jgi:hypothetical protein
MMIIMKNVTKVELIPVPAGWKANITYFKGLSNDIKTNYMTNVFHRLYIQRTDLVLTKTLRKITIRTEFDFNYFETEEQVDTLLIK